MIYKDETYDFNFINSYTIEDFSLGIQNYLDPYYNKDTLTGIRMLQTAVANELGLKGLMITDGHRHGMTLEASCLLIENGIISTIDMTGIEDNFLKKLKKGKGLSLMILLKDHDKEKIVWAGWTSLEKMKEKNTDLRIKKATRLIIEKY